MRDPIRVGLTGGIGSGKSTVAQTLLELGACIVDADAIARAVTAPGGPAVDPIRKHFGDALILAEGGLDRAKMRQLAFADPVARQQLEAIVHPLVGQETERQARATASRLVVFDVPLLIESGRWRQRVARVLVVDCLVETQIERVMQRSGWTREAVEKVVASQVPRDRRRAAADAVIYNDGITLHDLRATVKSLANSFGL